MLTTQHKTIVELFLSFLGKDEEITNSIKQLKVNNTTTINSKNYNILNQIYKILIYEDSYNKEHLLIVTAHEINNELIIEKSTSSFNIKTNPILQKVKKTIELINNSNNNLYYQKTSANLSIFTAYINKNFINTRNIKFQEPFNDLIILKSTILDEIFYFTINNITNLVKPLDLSLIDYHKEDFNIDQYSFNNIKTIEIFNDYISILTKENKSVNLYLTIKSKNIFLNNLKNFVTQKNILSKESTMIRF